MKLPSGSRRLAGYIRGSRRRCLQCALALVISLPPSPAPSRCQGPSLTPLQQLKAAKRGLVDRHARPDNTRAWVQVLNTLVPLAALWWAISLCVGQPAWLALLPTLGLSLLLLRAFVLMHECGHGSLFRSPGLNRAFGFVFGVLTGMPQTVWSRRHQFHHATNGNWDRYRGPLDILTVEDFAKLTPEGQRRYARQRCIGMAPLAGFLYVVFNPRVNWLKGSVQWLAHVLRDQRAHPERPWRESARGFSTPLWTTPQEYWHVCGNNLVLLGGLALLSAWIGPGLTLACAVGSMSLAGALGIVLFTVQHNFEQSHASGNEGWDYDRAALEGTSFLVLPGWLGWVTANIAYHHVHHLSARIPNYRLAACHADGGELFGPVTRMRLSQIPAALACILWDRQTQRLITVAEYRRQLSL